MPSNRQIGSPNIVRWIVLALIVGLAVQRWWQQPPPEAKPKVPVSDTERNTSKTSSGSVSDSDSTHDRTADVTLPRRDARSRDDSAENAASSHVPVSRKSDQSAPPNKTGPPRVHGLTVENVIVRDRDGDVVFQGDVDLTETLARIDKQRTISEFRNDGIEFKNLERRLPIKPRGHYREWVHPTPGQRGPGAQRVVTGNSGEAFYTWDHYEHFVRIRAGK